MNIHSLPFQICRDQAAREFQGDALGKVNDEPVVDVIELKIEAMRDKGLTQAEHDIDLCFGFPILGAGVETAKNQEQDAGDDEGDSFV
jgi:hypothetical protein